MMEMMNDDRPTVMVAEDSEDCRQMLMHWLSGCGFRAVCAADGWEAVKVAMREIPSLILMDLILPVLDGTEVICLLREHEELHDVPVVVITAHDTADARADASDVGCHVFITKPVDLERLEEIIRRLLYTAHLAADGIDARETPSLRVGGLS